jgi:hypothetical protein
MSGGASIKQTGIAVILPSLDFTSGKLCCLAVCDNYVVRYF